MVIFVFLLLAISFLVHASTSVGTTCHTITKPTDITSSMFASPLNLFSGYNEPLISVTCGDGSSVRIEVGSGAATQYIYMYGYRKVNGNWTRTTFTGSKMSGQWVIGSAGASVESVQSSETGQILAYVCQYIQNQWKCGCSDKECLTQKWQLQEYKLPVGTSGDTTPTSDGELDVHYPSKYIGLPGDKINLIGSGFKKTPSNSVLWNGKVQESGIISLTGSSLTITVPNLPPGKYEVRVKEGTNISKYGVNIWIGTGEDLPEPVISYISPESGLQGGTFTIHGEGFTKVNDVITTFGVLSNLPSEDGETIVIDEYDPFDEKLVSYTEEAERFEYAMPVQVTVMNTSGHSNMKEFKLNI